MVAVANATCINKGDEHRVAGIELFKAALFASFVARRLLLETEIGV
ncbi:MAG: hypothetical protein R3329_12535 [Pseudoalteromonas tetraodonis]|nr:hypothetical protein [Pseudoalteromonas tetraodonis]